MIEIAVCDDDVDDLNHVVSILHEIFSIQNIRYNIETFLSVNKMLDINKKIDIGVLDIAMAELNGIKAGRELKEKFPNVKLIYITNYEEYCMQAINDAHAYSFLCKPLDSHKMHSQIKEVILLLMCSFLSCFSVTSIMFQFMDSRYQKSIQKKYVYRLTKGIIILYVLYINLTNISLLKLISWFISISSQFPYVLCYNVFCDFVSLIFSLIRVRNALWEDITQGKQ